MRTVSFFPWMVMAAATLSGMPPTDGVQWWSTNPSLDCTSIHALIYEVPLASGGRGFACGITGTFVWLAAGGNWTTSLRAAAPASGAIGVQYAFLDQDGSTVSLDSTSGSSTVSGSSVSLVLSANQPSEIQLLGPSRDAPRYQATQTGSIFGIFFCSDPTICATLNPQLLYSFLPVKPWLLSVPISWESTFSLFQPSGLSKRWSAVGTQDSTHLISLAVRNESVTSAFYKVRVYDRHGSMAAEGATPVIPAGGVRGALLADIVGNTLSSGILKVVVEGDAASSVSVLQFDGDSAASLQTASDAAP